MNRRNYDRRNYDLNCTAVLELRTWNRHTVTRYCPLEAVGIDTILWCPQNTDVLVVLQRESAAGPGQTAPFHTQRMNKDVLYCR